MALTTFETASNNMVTPGGAEIAYARHGDGAQPGGKEGTK